MSKNNQSMVSYSLATGGVVMIPFDVYIIMTDEDFLDLEGGVSSFNLTKMGDEDLDFEE